MGNTRVRGDTKFARERLGAIRLRLAHPEKFLVAQAQRLADLVYAGAPQSGFSTGTLKSAFEFFELYSSPRNKGTGYNAVGVGDPNILTKPEPVAGAGYLKEFIDMLRAENSQRYESFQKQWRGVKVKREQYLEKIKTVRQQIAKTKKPKTVKRKTVKYTKAKYEEAQFSLGILLREIAFTAGQPSHQAVKEAREAIGHLPAKYRKRVIEESAKRHRYTPKQLEEYYKHLK